MPSTGITSRDGRQLIADAVVAGVLVVLALLEVTTGAYDGTDVPRWVAVLLAVVATAPMAVRRRAPLTSLLALLGPLWVLTAFRSDVIPFAALVALMLGTYTVASAATSRRSVLGLGLALASAEANALAAPGLEPGDIVFPVLLLAVPWFAGRGLRSWREQAAALLAANEALEQERNVSARLAVEAERGNIARDLHDTLVQSLNIVVVHAEAAEEALSKDAVRAADSMHRIQQVGRSALDDVRGMLGMLREHGSLTRPPRLEGLEELYDELRRAGVSVEVVVEGQLDPLAPAVEATLYRLVQEALTNVRKHAGAEHVTVRLSGRAGQVEVDVSDDGVGLAEPGRASSFGLVGMRERVALVGGTLTTQTGSTGGTSLCAVLPRQPR